MSFAQNLLRPLVYLTGNRLGQVLLKNSLKLTQYLMGAGAGGDISKSGEKAILPLVKTHCSAPYIIFDVGANRGQFLSLVHSIFRETGTFSIHAFEPSKFTFDILSRDFQRFEEIQLNNFALGQEKGKLTLYYPFEGTGYASLTQRNMSHLNLEFGMSEDCVVDTIDTYCERMGIPAINLLKIDVEGHEFEVLCGARGLFEFGKIDFCTFEFGGACIDTRISFKDFYYFFRKYRMKVYRITPSGYLNEIAVYNEIDEIYRDTNFLAAKMEMMP